MIPMNANPIRICPIVLATPKGQGAISWRLPNGGTVTPWSGSTTAPLASVKSPYNTGPPVGIGRVVGPAGMFPTFCTETPTCRRRNAGGIERMTNVALYCAFGILGHDDAPIHPPVM